MKEKRTGSMAMAAFAVVAAGFFLFGGDAPVEAVYPIERARAGFVRRVWTRVKGLFRASEAMAENARLRREVAALTLHSGDVERLENENARLRRALDYASRAPERWVPACVLSEDGAASGRGRTLRIDRGSLAGVCEGAVVVVPDGLVGCVEAVTPHTASVRLIVDESLKVSCEIECAGTPRPRGILTGGTEDMLVLRYLNHVSDVPPRSRVVTSGLGGVFPRGLTVGFLLDLKRDDGGLALSGEVQPSVDFASLEDVFVRREK